MSQAAEVRPGLRVLKSFFPMNRAFLGWGGRGSTRLEGTEIYWFSASNDDQGDAAEVRPGLRVLKFTNEHTAVYPWVKRQRFDPA